MSPAALDLLRGAVDDCVCRGCLERVAAGGPVEAPVSESGT